MAKFIRNCLTCGASNDAAALFCGCGALLGSIDPVEVEEISSHTESGIAAAAFVPTSEDQFLGTDTQTTSAGLQTCSSCKRLQLEVGLEQCVQCGEDLPKVTIGQLEVIWPWGRVTRMDGLELMVGRESGPEWLQTLLGQNGFVNLSRRHALFKMEGPNLVVTDLNSLNGTFVSDERLTPSHPRVFSLPCEVRLGINCVLRFRWSETSA